MKSVEEVWKKQMGSLQSSLLITKKSPAIDDSSRDSDASVNASDYGDGTWDTANSCGMRQMSVGLSVFSRFTEELEQRSQVFGNDAKFLVEVKSGQVEASLNPDKELRRLKEMFEAWKKDYDVRLQENKVILNKLRSKGVVANRAKKWWEGEPA